MPLTDIDPRLRPIRPSHARNFVYQMGVLGGLYALVYVFIRVGSWWWLVGWIPALCAGLATILTLQSLAGLLGVCWNRRDTVPGAFRSYLQAGSEWLHVMISGVAVGPQIFTAAPHAASLEELLAPGKRSIARVFLEAGHSVLLFFYDQSHQWQDRILDYTCVYDEAELFEQLHGRLEFAARYSGHTRVVLHLHSMGYGFGRRFMAYIGAVRPDHHYRIVALRLIQPAAKLRPVQQVLVVWLGLYGGSRALQWLWTHGLYAAVWPANKADQRHCRAEDREDVFKLMRHLCKYVSVYGLLARMNAMQRDRSWKVPGETPPYGVWATDLAHDEAVNPQGNRSRLDLAFGGSQAHRIILSPKDQVGHHGTLAEWAGWWMEDSRLFLMWLTDKAFRAS